ncbi:MAG: ABC transporter ATP-binding protein [bacterium]|nr:ABC transporter ATP-binding protein [bacterium]
MIRLTVLRRVLSYARPYWLWVIAGLISMLMGLALSLVVPGLIREAIDRAILREEAGILMALGVGVIGVTLIRGVFTFLERYSMEYVAQRTIYDLRNQMYRHLQRLSFSFYDQARTGQLMSRATQDVETLRRFLGFGVVNILANSLLFLSILGILAALHWRLTLVALLTLPFAIAVVVQFGRKVRPAYSDIQQQLAVITNTLQENITGVRVVRAFAREDHETEKFAAVNQGYLERALKAARMWAFYFPLVNFLTAGGTALVLWYGGREVIAGRLTPGSFVAFNTYLVMLITPLRMLGWLVNLAQRAGASSQRVFELLDTDPGIKDRPGARELPPARGEVVFEEVSFSYEEENGDRPALRGVSLVARPGETIALLGATGSGKTSIINLVPRFYDPTGGRILVDGVDIREVTLDSLRRQIGVVLQDTFLFSASLRENIAFGRPGARLDDIVAAAKAAHIHDFIQALPRGYDTLVGERGVGLSGGQKQRVAIARALLMDPRILILDDSTSSVDVETEYHIQQALEKLMAGRTAFVIAQRLSTVKNADQILVLEDGRIVERGSHDELLARAGVYAKIYELQLCRDEVA